MKTCNQCEYFQLTDLRTQTNERVGICYGSPPSMVIMMMGSGLNVNAPPQPVPVALNVQIAPTRKACNLFAQSSHDDNVIALNSKTDQVRGSDA